MGRELLSSIARLLWKGTLERVTGAAEKIFPFGTRWSRGQYHVVLSMPLFSRLVIEINYIDKAAPRSLNDRPLLDS